MYFPANKIPTLGTTYVQEISDMTEDLDFVSANMSVFSVLHTVLYSTLHYMRRSAVPQICITLCTATPSV